MISLARPVRHDRIREARFGAAVAPGPILVALALTLTIAPKGQAADVVVGAQTGLYLPELGPGFANSTERADSATSYFVSPTLGLNAAPFGLALRYIFSSYELFGIDLNKHDIDVGLRYSIHPNVELLAG